MVQFGLVVMTNVRTSFIRSPSSSSSSSSPFFSGLSEWLQNPDLEKISAQPATLSTIKHKVVMDTAPEGNQYPGTSSSSNHLSYKVDRPFLFLIRDEASGALLLIGRVVNPKNLTK